MGPGTRFVTLALASALLATAGGCEFEGATAFPDEGSEVGPDAGGGDGDGGELAAVCGEAPPAPRDIRIQCGDTVIPVLDAFRRGSDAALRFAPVPGNDSACPFLVEDSRIRAGEVTSCTPFVAAEEDAEAEGDDNDGRDRVRVTWCWYSDEVSFDEEDGCCLANAGAIDCDTTRVEIRFECDGGSGAPAGSGEPLDEGPAMCAG